MNHCFDVLIVGGGMIGANLAIALKNSHLNIGLIEAHPLKTDSQPSYDDRGIALSYGSQRIFETMGLWPDMAPFATAISDIHISDRGHFGVTRLSAKQQQVPALGQVVIAREFGALLNTQLQQQQNLTLLCPNRLTSLSQHSDHIDIKLDTGEQYQTKLLVAADGKNSPIRELLNLDCWKRDYHQTAITANISTDKPHNGMAYERFTEHGPIALLPLSEQRSSLVWTLKSGDEAALLAGSDDDFLTQLQQHFGYRAGRFVRAGIRHSYPLDSMQMDQSIQPRIAFIGNAAHSLHPIAGQGFNLGLRDVAVLADLLVDATDCGDTHILYDYQTWRQKDQDQIVNATDKLVRLSSNNVLGHFRGAGLTILDSLPSAKNWLARQSMGLNQKHPRLARGIKL